MIPDLEPGPPPAEQPTPETPPAPTPEPDYRAMAARRQRRIRRIVVSVVTVAVLLGAGVVVALAPLGTFPWQRDPWTPGTQWRTTSDAEPPVWPADELDFPPLGLEEQGTRLLPVPKVAEPSIAYRLVMVPHASGDGEVPLTWSPCRPIHYVVNPDGAPDDFIERVNGVVAQLSAATGIAFVYDGPTTELPTDGRPPFQPDRYGDRWAPVLIGFADGTEIEMLRGETIGVGGSDTAYALGGSLRSVSGTALLDVELLDERKLWGEPFYVSVLRHELGHVLGLDHITMNKQLMAPASPMIDFQPGDLSGLAELGVGPCAPDL